MTVILLPEYNTRCYGVTFQNNGSFIVQKLEDISNHENNIFCVKPLEIFVGKSKVCNMTKMSAALDKSVFDGNSILPKICEEKYKYFYIGGDMIVFFPN